MIDCQLRPNRVIDERLLDAVWSVPREQFVPESLKAVAYVDDELLLPGGWPVTIAGVYSDYGNPIGQVIVGNDGLTAHYSDVPRLRYAVRVAPAKAARLAPRRACRSFC